MSEQEQQEMYLVVRDPVMQAEMDFYLNPADGSLQVDEEGRDAPFYVVPEAVLALYQYLEGRKEIILEAQKQVIQQRIDFQDLFPGAEMPPRFELVPVEQAEEVD